jgi:stage II sporulation protein GA (sporulation sigma-E factor processing peptidase)
MGLQKVYAELVFLDNFAVNLLIILLASQLTRVRKRWGRYALAAAAGGIYACVAFGVPAASLLPVRVAVGVTLGVVAFWVRGERGAWSGVCAFWAASFVLAGTVYAILAAYGETITAGGVLIVRPPARGILLGLLTGAVITALLARVQRHVRQREAHCVRMTLTMGTRRAEVKAFVDTGNFAREPLSGLSVIFLSRPAAQTLLEPTLLALLLGCGATETDRLRFVPCDTASGGGVFCGIEIDRAALNGAPGGTRAVVCLSRRPLVDGCGAVIGSGLMYELEKGAQYEDGDVVAQTGGMGAAAAEADDLDGIYRRQRGASAAAVPRGGGHAAAPAEKGRQDGKARAD